MAKMSKKMQAGYMKYEKMEPKAEKMKEAKMGMKKTAKKAVKKVAKKK